MNPADARARMVAAIAAEGGARDRAVLDALAQVRREAFVPRFWVGPAPGSPGGGGRVFDATGDDPDPAAVRLVYDKDRALAIRDDPAAPGGTTSTASAPGLMASMLELLALRPGLRVLEIGTGSGYNAALLAALVGDPSLVTSIDIDADLVEQAARRLEAEGCGGVHLLAGDGAAGAPGATFDRVVATVGCVDLAPAWLSQLAPDGFVLLPLQHGPAHPLVRARPQDGGATADIVGRSGFVAIQGLQAGQAPWVAGQAPAPDDRWADLPAELARAVGADGGSSGGAGPESAGGRRGARGRGGPERRGGSGGPERRGGSGGWWDLGYYLAITDRRAGLPTGLADGAGSGAWIPSATSRVAWDGPWGPALRDRLLALAGEWSQLGRPAATDFRCRFTTPPGPGHVGRVAHGTWVVDRVDHRQTLRLTARGEAAISGSPR